MSRHHPPKYWKPVQPQAVPIFGVKESAQVAQLIAVGKFGFAVDKAKQIHKRCANAASEALLVDAYIARINSLVERNLEVEARSLIDLVRERYPSSRERLRDAAALFAARCGELDLLLQPLNDPSLPPQRRATIEKWIRSDVSDLRALSQANALAPEHPLRAAAAALARAFEAVTSGPVEDEALALPEVPHRSPLAPWKMLVRAIAAFYRREDESCEKYLQAIEPHAAAARLAPALRALLGQKPPLTPAALSLVREAGGDLEVLRAALQKLDQQKNRPHAFQEIRDALAACKQACPGLLDRLKQHISVWGMLAGLDENRVLSALEGGVRKDAYYWRLAARAFEEKAPLTACGVWEEFRRQALQEAWFSEKGPEVATLYLHMADLMARLPEEELEELRRQRRNQGLYWLWPDNLLERACQADPCSENFQRWLDLVKRRRVDAADSVAERWRAALPNDIPPLLHLMQSAEKNNALQKAFKLMERAERLDGLNPEVRKARLRLLVSITRWHLQQKNTRLAEADLRAMEALPLVQQGDRPAFVAALRWVWCVLRGAHDSAAAAGAEVARRLGGEVAAAIVLTGVCAACKLRLGPQTPEIAGASAIAAAGRAYALGDDMGVPFPISRQISGQLLRELSRKETVPDASGLGALGEAALRANNFELAYAAAGAGLAGGAAHHARFLFLRARSLPPWDDDRWTGCIGAAAELARRQRDLDLLHQIAEHRQGALGRIDFDEDSHVAMTTEEMQRVLLREKDQPEYPSEMPVESGLDEGLPPEVEEMIDEYGPDVLAQALGEILGLGGPKRRKGRRRDFPF